MWLHLCLLSILLQSDPRPPALVALEQSRQAIVSGEVRWVYTPSMQKPGHEFSFVNRYARNGDRIHEERGDQDGWVVWDADGPVSKFPQIYLTNDDGVWRYAETDYVCDLWKPDGEIDVSQSNPSPSPEQFRDIRNIGIHPSSMKSFRSGTECLWGLPEPRVDAPPTEPRPIEWTQVLRDGKYEVTAMSDSGTEVTWVIDPDRGWNAEQITAKNRRGSVYEVTCSLRKFGDVWFPEHVTHSVDGVTHEEFHVLEASFNQPDDPKSFSAVDMGIQPGFNVSPQNFRVQQHVLIWDGDQPVTIVEWQEAVRSGKKKPGPAMIERMKTGGGTSPYLTEEQRREWHAEHRAVMLDAELNKPLSSWERYVRDFIQRYQLDQEQSDKAIVILRECQKRGLDYINARKAEFTEVQSEFEEARKAEDAEKLERLRARITALQEPIDRIFETQLKPRLARLPTRAQREAVEKHQTPTASQPAP